MANLGLGYFCQRHSYDEYGVCFECGERKPETKSRAPDMARLRAKRREAGYVRVEFYVTPAEREKLKAALRRMRANR